MMTRASTNTLMAVLATSAGIGATLLVASLFVNENPELLAAERRFSDLPRSEARRIQATFDHLYNSDKAQAEQQRIESIHGAVKNDPDLVHRLQQLYAWWETRDDAQRTKLRESQKITAGDWLNEMQRQISEPAASDTISLQLPGRPGRRGVRHVSSEQVNQFLKAALPDELPPDDKSLLESVVTEDRLLARVLVIARSIYRSRSGSFRIDPDAVERTLDAAEKHLLAGSVPADRKGERAGAMISMGILRSITDKLSADFLGRNTLSDEEIQREFFNLESPERIKQMMSDPATAVRAMQARLRSVDKESPTGRLAVWLTEFNRKWDDVRRRASRSQRAPGPDSGPRGRPRQGDRGQRDSGTRDGDATAIQVLDSVRPLNVDRRNPISQNSRPGSIDPHIYTNGR